VTCAHKFVHILVGRRPQFFFLATAAGPGKLATLGTDFLLELISPTLFLPRTVCRAVTSYRKEGLEIYGWFTDVVMMMRP
jgi:hypothetical protein